MAYRPKILIGLTEKGILEYNHNADIQKGPKAHFVLASLFRANK